jgi:hypothetical protein
VPALSDLTAVSSPGSLSLRINAREAALLAGVGACIITIRSGVSCLTKPLGIAVVGLLVVIGLLGRTVG